MQYHPPILIDTLEKLDEALFHWKNTTFSQHYLKLDDVVGSLKKPNDHLVDARQEFAARWILCPPGGKKPATLWTVEVWRWNSDLETGNFVPPGETAPARLPESRIQTTPNNLCRWTYVLDTTHDKSLWEAQKVFEDYIQTASKFNPSKKGRREFQNGLGLTNTFHLNSQMFVKRTAYTRGKEASRMYPLHDWIKNATKKGMPYFANDEKPSFFESADDGGLRPLSESFPPTLKVGDLVWMSFAMEFFIGTTHWSTNFIPYEFVRVGSVALEVLPEIKKDFNEGEEEEGPRERLGIGMRGISATQARQLNTVGDLLQAPIAEQPERTFTQANAGPIVTAVKSDDPVRPVDGPERSQILVPENFGPPRSPRAFLDSESEEVRTETSNEVRSEEDEINGHIQLEDDGESTMQDYMSVGDTSFIVDNDSPLTDDDATLTDDDASLMDDDTSFQNATDMVGVCDPAAATAGSPARNFASMAPLPSLPTSNGKLRKELGVANQPKTGTQLAADHQSSSTLKGKKRAASTERPSADKVTDGITAMGDRVLRQRIAKGKGVAY